MKNDRAPTEFRISQVGLFCLIPILIIVLIDNGGIPLEQNPVSKMLLYLGATLAILHGLIGVYLFFFGPKPNTILGWCIYITFTTWAAYYMTYTTYRREHNDA